MNVSRQRGIDNATGSGRQYRRVPAALLIAFSIIWLLLAIKPLYRQDWLLENVIVILAVLALVITDKKVGLSNASCTAIFLFLTLHEIGAHYTYSEVPYDAWWQNLTGFSLNESLGWERNHFDRAMHLLYGALVIYPIHEIVVRSGKFPRSWSYVLPLLLVTTTSTAYELIEWGAAVLFGGDLGMAYLGTQGDIWDAQKDMALAGIGAIVGVLTVYVIAAAGYGQH